MLSVGYARAHGGGDGAAHAPGAIAGDPRESGGVEGMQALAQLRSQLFGRPHAKITMGRYALLERVGSGGLGVVYAAFDPELDRKVAIKLLRQPEPGRSDVVASKRLLREAQAIARLSHPNVIEVYDAGTYEHMGADLAADGEGPASHGVFIVMELVHGKALNEWLHDRPRDWRQVLPVFIAAGRGLAAAHAAGVLHRDFKPPNVLVDEGGRVRVLDFGLARAASASSDELDTLEVSTVRPRFVADTPITPHSSHQLTLTGAVMGTPAYMPPEQHLGQQLDHRSDQYSFCVALYEALYGRRPFSGSVNEMTAQKLFARPKASEIDRGIPRWLHRATVRGLNPDPDGRWPSMDSLLERLGRHAHDRRPLVVFGAAALVGVLAVAGARGGNDGPVCERGEEHLSGVWDGARQEQVRQALVGVSEDAWGVVRERLDLHTTQWLAAHSRSCDAVEARRISPAIFDRQMLCLQRRLDEVGALVDVLTDPDREAVANAGPAAAKLQSIDDCVDRNGLHTGVAPPVEGSVDAVAQVRATLARVRALESIGRYEEGRAVAREALDAARAIDYGPAVSEALLRLGALHDRLGDYASGTDALSDAYWTAMSCRDDRGAARAASSLLFHTGVRLRDLPRAAAWERHADAAVERIGRGGTDEAEYLTSRGAVALFQNRFHEASDDLEHALAIRIAQGAPSPDDISNLHNNLGNASYALGDYSKARAHYERATAVFEQAMGRSHPQLGHSLHNLGITAISQGRMDEAFGYLDRALTLWETTLGPQHPNLAIVLNSLGAARQIQRRFEDAEAYLKRAAAIYERGSVADPRRAWVLKNLGDIADERGHLDQALAYYRRARSALEAASGAGQAQHPSLQISIAATLAAQNRHAEADVEILAAVETTERILGAWHPDVARALAYLGDIEIERGNEVRARPALERALAILERADAEPNLLARTRLLLAIALPSAERERGRTLAGQAEAWMREQPELFAVMLPEARRWLADHPVRQ